MKIFKESQRFNQWWLIALIVFVFLKIGYDLLIVYREEPKFNTDASSSLIISSIILILVTILIFSLKLKTRIDENGIAYQFSPFHIKAKNVSWESLNKCVVRKYSPIVEYGGWGFRGIVRLKMFGVGENGRAYNIRGNIGIQMELKDGRKILIGTQKTEQAKQVIKNYSYKLTNNKII